MHVHIIALSFYCVYLDIYYRANTLTDKAAAVNNYATDVLDMTAGVDINEYPKHRVCNQTTSRQNKPYSVQEETKDASGLADDCMCDHSKRFCMRDTHQKKSIVCQVKEQPPQQHQQQQ